MKTYIATVNSLSLCSRGQRSLAKEGIFSRIVPLDPALTGVGCAYGIEFSTSDAERVKSILRRERIGYGRLIDGRLGGGAK